MAGELVRPGVEVIQSLATPAPTFVRPTLVPCVVGPAFEVTKIFNSDNSINAGSLFGDYTQLGLSITESSFPAPRGNADELDVQENTVHPYLSAGGQLHKLPLTEGFGTGFMLAYNKAAAAAFQTVIFSGNTGLAIVGKTIVFAIDNPANADTSHDISLTFTGSGSNLTSAQAAAQFNTAAGKTIATIVGAAPNDKIQLQSPSYGAGSSVTIRAGGSANTTLQIGYSGGSNQHEERMEGAGFRAQDQSNNTTQSPWIEFYIGAYILDGTSISIVAHAGLVAVDPAGSTFNSALLSAVTFGGGSPTIPVAVGDYVYADGTRLASGEITKIETSRFKIGIIDAALSTADSNGNYTNKVYDVATVGTIFDVTPFLPKYVYFVANNIDWTKAVPTAAFILGSATGTAATAGVVTGSGAIAGPFSLTGLKLHLVVVANGVTTDSTLTFSGAFANMAAVEAAINGFFGGIVASDDAASPPQLILTTSATGETNSITVKKDGTANTILGFSTGSDTTGTGTDVVFSTLAGKTLSFKLNSNPHIYTVVMPSTSLNEAVAEINRVVGATVASIGGGSNNKLLLTSNLLGLASGLTVIVPSPTSAETVFGVTGGVTAGTGRPFPDAYFDGSNILHINADLIRDPVTGYPLDQTTNTASLYIEYTALRKDVTAVAKVAGVLRIPDTTTLSSVLNPLTEENPLGLAAFLMMLNAPNNEVKVLGVDEVTAAATTGTAAAYARAAGLLEAEEVYAIAPLSQDEVIHGLWATHVLAMSEPEQGGERIVFINKVMPTRHNPAIALSGSNANSTVTNNQMLLDGNPAAGLIAAGVNPALPIPVSAGVYLEFEDNSGNLLRYNVSSVTGALVNFNVTFTAGQNDDAFYTTTKFIETVVDAAYSLNVRGSSLVIPGSNPARLDYSLVSSTVSDANSTLKNRRVYSVFPDTIKTVVGGIEKSLAGYYACAAVAGMVSAQPPQQGFTNFPITGLTGVVGTEKFTKKQLNIMAGGGTYILIQDVQGGAVSSRHQLSTDLTSIETRELSITKVVDFVAKFMRLGVRRYIGINVINPQLLDTLATTVQGMLTFLSEIGVLNGGSLNNLLQDATQPDTLLIDVTLDIPFPCNYIRLTLVA